MGWGLMGRDSMGRGLTDAVPMSLPPPIIIILPSAAAKLRASVSPLPPPSTAEGNPHFPSLPPTPNPARQWGKGGEGGGGCGILNATPQTLRGFRNRARWKPCRSDRSERWRNTSSAGSPGASGGFCCVCRPCAASPPPSSSNSSSSAWWAKPPSRPSSETCCSPGRLSAGPTARCSDGGILGGVGMRSCGLQGVGAGIWGGSGEV